MKQLIANINKVLAAKIEEKNYVNDNDLERIFYQEAGKAGYSTTDGELGIAKKGKTRKFIIYTENCHLIPFILIMQRKQFKFSDLNKLTYTSVSIQDEEIENVIDKKYTELISEAKNSLVRTESKLKNKLSKMEEDFNAKLKEMGITLGEFVEMNEIFHEIQGNKI